MSHADSNLLIRADASASIGTGHVMRCLALAQAWQDRGWRVAFAMAQSTPSVEQRLLANRCEVLSVDAEPGTLQDANRAAHFAAEQHASWVVADGYQFGAEYQERLKAAGLQVLVLEDYGHSGRYTADLVLDQNVCADGALYEKRSAFTKLLLGPRYCLLRREFVAMKTWGRRIPEQAQHLLVSMGGSDPQSLTARVIESLSLVEIEGLHVKVVAGGSNPQYKSLRVLAEESSRKAIKMEVQPDVTNMAKLMAWADVAIAAAGSTCWELCMLGLPALLLDAAGHQIPLARELARLECAVYAGSSSEMTAAKVAHELDTLVRSAGLRQTLSQNCRRLVDGAGARRVVSAMIGGLRLRRAGKEDVQLLWNWANDADVRSNSFASEPIPWDTHVEWLRQKLAQPDCMLFIAEDSPGNSVGQIRLDGNSNGEMYVNLSLSKERRGQGLAAALIDRGVDQAFADGNCRQIHALVKPGNAASLRAFECAGFTRVGIEQIRGTEAVHLILNRL